VSGFLAFCDEYHGEDTCIQALSDLKWLEGFTCDKCQSAKAYHLEIRPRIFEWAACSREHAITAAKTLHKTRTPLRKWFMATYLVGHDKRGLSATFISRPAGRLGCWPCCSSASGRPGRAAPGRRHWCRLTASRRQ
jgi:hypothetical protein